MANNYSKRQLLLIINELCLIIYFFTASRYGKKIDETICFHITLITLLFFDAAYISYRNIKNNKTLNHFIFLLMLAAWQFTLSIFGSSKIETVATDILLTLTLYQTIYFLQSFWLQAATYKHQASIIFFLRLTCALTAISIFAPKPYFALAFLLQLVLAFLSVLYLFIVNYSRALFVFQAQKKELLQSFVFVLLPFSLYIAAFYNQADYLSNIGSYFIIFMSCFSVHSIVLQYKTLHEPLLMLSKGALCFLCILSLLILATALYLLAIPFFTIFIFVHIMCLLMLIYNLLLYMELKREPSDFENKTDRQHFYAYSLSQLRQEETLRKDFSNYLHDDILQDLLSIKNLVAKADKPEIHKLIVDTLEGLNTSIRSQMQVYHPTLLKSLTLKENIQALLDSLSEHRTEKPYIIKFDCDDSLFLVEPYDIVIYRIIKELTTNAIKHACAKNISVFLLQKKGKITLKISDDGKGFEPSEYKSTEHKGLTSIKEQVSLLNGKMSICSSPYCITEITITMPMKGDNSYENFIS